MSKKTFILLITFVLAFSVYVAAQGPPPPPGQGGGGGPTGIPLDGASGLFLIGASGMFIRKMLAGKFSAKNAKD